MFAFQVERVGYGGCEVFQSHGFSFSGFFWVVVV
jgi:hypothetical protein